MQRRPAVFLDRDETLIANRAVTAGTDHVGDLWEPELVRLLPGVAEGMRRLADAGFVRVVVSNQGAVARGRCTLEQVEACNARMRELLRRQGGADVDAVYVCPYHPSGSVHPWSVEHPWRKPRPGMFLAAEEDLSLELGRSWLIGDAERDAEAGVAAGIAPERCLIVREGGFEAAVESVIRGSGLTRGESGVRGGKADEEEGIRA